ncbi:UDP-glycosyltransferase 91C1-like [Iris pallida]|uniref:UDP-glycosyltransferase 91C1-like n=1 Tax=Iris pallida TaxID=29817 RepID=A0AAX6E7X8_IRIPA|nr:UDP-glycosyltransferase 91C1-like [Iris pallida]
MLLLARQAVPIQTLLVIEMATDSPLHVAFLPWLAGGHLTPYVGLATRIALLGHRVSFLSTPPNLLRLPTSDSHLPSLLRLVPLTPSVQAPVSSTSELTDSTEHLRPLLRCAYDSHSGPLADFLSSAAPPVDWLLCDYSPYWAAPVARSLNVRTAFLSVFGAAVLGFFGPPDELIRPRRTSPSHPTGSPSRPRWRSGCPRPGRPSGRRSVPTPPASRRPTASASRSGNATWSPSGAATSSSRSGWISSRTYMARQCCLLVTSLRWRQKSPSRPLV